MPVYATRTIRLLDGRVVDDTAPFDSQPEKPAQDTKRQKKPSMSFLTAFSLSMNNLMTIWSPRPTFSSATDARRRRSALPTPESVRASGRC